MKDTGNEHFLCGMWEYFTFNRAEERKILAHASRERQEGMQDQWQQESPFRKVLEQVNGVVSHSSEVSWTRKH